MADTSKNETFDKSTIENEADIDKKTEIDVLKHELIQTYGLAYQGYGLNKLMGHIIGLLLFSSEPLSLDDISEQLNMSKGPISQIARRLHEGNQIKKIWFPGSRKDYYEIHPDLLANTFLLNMQLVHSNILIAQRIKGDIDKIDTDSLADIKERMNEMEEFYQTMEKYFTNFLEVWSKEKESL